MINVTLGSTGITVPQNGFGALPIQRDSMEVAADLLKKAYEGGMQFFDTARAYSDSEDKEGLAFGQAGGIFETKREDIVIATKTHALTPEDFWKDLETSLSKMNCKYIDIYQFHQMNVCWKPGDGSGMYEAMLDAKKQGKIHHIGGTTHKIGIAKEIVESGFYETLQYPFSYLASEEELKLYQMVKDHNMGFICMKGLAGGLINNSKAAMAFMSQFDNALPIWGIQRESELSEWLFYMFLRIRKDEDTYIVSKDNGFDAAVKLGRRQGIERIYRISTINEIFKSDNMETAALTVEDEKPKETSKPVVITMPAQPSIEEVLKAAIAGTPGVSKKNRPIVYDALTTSKGKADFYHDIIKMLGQQDGLNLYRLVKSHFTEWKQLQQSEGK